MKMKKFLLGIGILTGTALSAAIEPPVITGGTPETAFESEGIIAGECAYANALALIVPDGNVVTINVGEVNAVMTPDFIGESAVVFTEPGREYYIPADNYTFMLFSENGNRVEMIAWDNPEAEVKLADGVVTITGAERKVGYYLLDCPGIWKHVTTQLNDQEWLPVDWKIPFAADFQVAYRKEIGAMNSENGTQEDWKIMPFRDIPMQVATSLAIYDGKTWSNWVSGYGGTFYPARADKDNTYLRFLYAGEYPHQKHDVAFGAFIYPMGADPTVNYWEGMEVPAQPEALIMPKEAILQFLDKEQWQSISEKENDGKWFPATCGTTEAIEKIFYRSEAYELREEVATRIDAMDKFVRRIRERIEHFREWGKNEREFLTANAGEANQDITRLFAADFDEMEKFYADVLHLIKTPADCEVLSAEIVALANDENGDEEELEERCKELGRAIRTIGGAQDNTAAQFRRVGKNVRQKATVHFMTEKDPVRRQLWAHVRSEAGKALHDRMPHEGK